MTAPGCLAAPLFRVDPIILNGEFDADIQWIKDANTTIIGGKCNCNGAGNFLQQNDRLASGVTYNYRFDWTTGASQIGGRLRLGCNGGALSYTQFFPGANQSGTYTGSFVGSSSEDFVLQSDQQVFYGTIDNLVVTKA